MQLLLKLIHKYGDAEREYGPFMYDDESDIHRINLEKHKNDILDQIHDRIETLQLIDTLIRQYVEESDSLKSI